MEISTKPSLSQWMTNRHDNVMQRVEKQSTDPELSTENEERINASLARLQNWEQKVQDHVSQAREAKASGDLEAFTYTKQSVISTMQNHLQNRSNNTENELVQHMSDI